MSKLHCVVITALRTTFQHRLIHLSLCFRAPIRNTGEKLIQLFNFARQRITDTVTVTHMIKTYLVTPPVKHSNSTGNLLGFTGGVF